MADYREACEYIEKIPKFGSVAGLENIRMFLDAIEHPETAYKCVHIAGTNGKGSVAKMTALMLEEAGYRVGLFISPHLVRMNERISVNGEEISDEEFAGEFEYILSSSATFSGLSYFEFVFAMAADYFAKKNCDYVVFETGLGGRLDATNVINPVISVITSIGFDHMAVLGNTIEEIAGEKAGIIKPGVPVVYNTGSEVADRVIEEKCREMEAVISEREVSGETTADSGVQPYFRVPDRFAEIVTSEPEIGAIVDAFAEKQPAVYQFDNATTAVVAFLECAGYEGITNNKILCEWTKKALRKFTWPGRMEFLSDGIVIDGAHNEDASKQFVRSVQTLMKNGRWSKLSLLFAVCADKDYEDIIRILCENLDLEDVYVTEISSGRKASAKIVGTIFQNYRPAGEYWDTCYFNNVKSAWDTAVRERQEDTLLAVVGSLYLVGEIKGLLEYADPEKM